MKFPLLLPFFLFCLCFLAVPAQARVDAVDLYAEAVMTADIPELEKLLAPNYWHIGPNGHIQDKAHFIESIKSRQLVVNHLSLSNQRETRIGQTRLLTANGEFKGVSTPPHPQGLMRFTMVLVNSQGQDQVVLFQATPVQPTTECSDGNCRIK
ncbi:MAG: nuclear transport factor 2 family protein [Desulfovibrio sp.]|nr:nuclear transport factor 2 family protein [Desulfovibrio sp.]